MADRVSATPAALDLINTLTKLHGPVMFFQSGGCCENSVPLCYPQGEFKISPNDVHLGMVGGAPYYMSHREFEYAQNTHLIVDVVQSRGGTFALDGPDGTTFIARSRLFTDEELAELAAEKI
ncbi:MAG: DUF779 domain-containing protein [Methylobacillus sp.]|jgi:uncharacterized protein (DUF779 family)|nr:DUF779 domain-containing protein [Methylobacillus sp.]